MRLNDACNLFYELPFPMTSTELVAAVGDRRIEHPSGSETVADVFARLETDIYTCPEDAELMFRSGLSDAAIGRKGYSDRDPHTPGTSHPDHVSF